MFAGNILLERTYDIYRTTDTSGVKYAEKSKSYNHNRIRNQIRQRSVARHREIHSSARAMDNLWYAGVLSASGLEKTQGRYCQV